MKIVSWPKALAPEKNCSAIQIVAVMALIIVLISSIVIAETDRHRYNPPACRNRRANASFDPEHDAAGAAASFDFAPAIGTSLTLLACWDRRISLG